MRFRQFFPKKLHGIETILVRSMLGVSLFYDLNKKQYVTQYLSGSVLFPHPTCTYFLFRDRTSGFVVTLNIWRLPAANESELVEGSLYGRPPPVGHHYRAVFSISGGGTRSGGASLIAKRSHRVIVTSKLMKQRTEFYSHNADYELWHYT